MTSCWMSNVYWFAPEINANEPLNDWYCQCVYLKEKTDFHLHLLIVLFLVHSGTRWWWGKVLELVPGAPAGKWELCPTMKPLSDILIISLDNGKGGVDGRSQYLLIVSLVGWVVLSFSLSLSLHASCSLKRVLFLALSPNRYQATTTARRRSWGCIGHLFGSRIAAHWLLDKSAATSSEWGTVFTDVGPSPVRIGRDCLGTNST